MIFADRVKGKELKKWWKGKYNTTYNLKPYSFDFHSYDEDCHSRQLEEKVKPADASQQKSCP